MVGAGSASLGHWHSRGCVLFVPRSPPYAGPPTCGRCVLGGSSTPVLVMHLVPTPAGLDALMCSSQQPRDFSVISDASGPFDSPGPLHGGDKSRLVGVMGCLLCSAWLCSALQQVRGWGWAQVSCARGIPWRQWE